MTSDDRPPIEAVLFDADGILQFPVVSVHGWISSMGRLGGPGFWREASAAEHLTLRGEADLRPKIEAILARRGREVTFEDVMRPWYDWRPRPEALAIVQRLRAAGVRCVLATNQQSYRGAYMQATHGYQDLLDATFYSFEVGHAKPDAGFFAAIGTALGLPADRMLLVDDHPANVTGAIDAGLRGRYLPTASSADDLARALREEGLPA